MWNCIFGFKIGNFKILILAKEILSYTAPNKMAFFTALGFLLADLKGMENERISRDFRLRV